MEFELCQTKYGRTPIAAMLLKWIQHYNGVKYWRRRAIVVDGSNKTCRLLKLYYLLWIKRVDAHHNASMGTSLNAGAQFITPLSASWFEWHNRGA